MDLHQRDRRTINNPRGARVTGAPQHASETFCTLNRLNANANLLGKPAQSSESAWTLRRGADQLHICPSVTRARRKLGGCEGFA
jgi:hypothetical protein